MRRSNSAGSAPVAEAESDADELRTEFEFTLPRGLRGSDGRVHRAGVMRLATARDELIPLRDDRVREHPEYLSIVLLARVITRIGDITDVHAGIVEELPAGDLAYLQEFYRRVNTQGNGLVALDCPDCGKPFEFDLAGERLGES